MTRWKPPIERPDSREGEARPRRIGVLIADPVDLSRQGLSGLLSAQQDLEIVASCGTVEDAVYESVARSPDVVLVGYGFPEAQRLEAVRRILADRPSLPVVVVSDRPKLDAFLSCIKAGVSGYLGGNVEASALAETVRVLDAGGCMIEPTIMRDVFLFLARVSTSTGSAAGLREGNSPLSRLSRREQEVLRLMAQGMGNKEIASTLGITPGTTKTHLRHIFRKLHVSDRTGAVLAALEIDPRRLLPAA